MPADQSIKDIPIEGREFEGSLRVFKFPEILQFLALGKRSGTLELNQENRRVELTFGDGKIININTPERSMRLGQMLLYSGAVTRAALDKALETQDLGGGTKFLGEILIEQGAIATDPLKQALTQQLEEDIWDLFSWESGNFRFDQTAVRNKGTIGVELETAPLVAAGQRRMQDWVQVCQNISNPQEIMRISSEFAGAPEQPLDEKVWRVLSLINGRLSVETLVRLSNLGKFTTYAALDLLLRSDIITRSTGDGRGAGDGAKDNRLIRPASGPGIGGAATVRLNVSDLQEQSPAAVDGKGKKPAKTGKGFMGLLKGGGGEVKADLPVDAQKEYFTDIALVCAVVNATIHRLSETGVLPGSSQDEIVDFIWRIAEQRFPRADILELRGSTLSAELYDRYARLEGGITRALAGTHDDCLEALRLFWTRLKEKGVESMGGEKEAAHAMDKVLAAFSTSVAILSPPEFTLNRWKENALGPVTVAASESNRRKR